MGLTPRRNPELVVAVLWQKGEFSYYPARIGAKVVEAFVDKKRRLANNLPPPKAAQPIEVGAVWSTPGSPAGAKRTAAAHIQSGHFFVQNGQVVAANDPAAKLAARQGTISAQRPTTGAGFSYF